MHYGSFIRQLKTFCFNNAFSYAVRPLVTAGASDSMFYPLTMCAFQIVFMIIMIMIMSEWIDWLVGWCSCRALIHTHIYDLR